MGRKRKTREGEPELELLAFDSLVHLVYRIIGKMEGQSYSVNQLTTDLGARSHTDRRVIANAVKGKNISKEKFAAITEGIKKRIDAFIDQEGGIDQLVDVLKEIIAEDSGRAFEWLLKRFEDGKPPYFVEDDMIVNRDDRHLIEEYRIELAVGPTPGASTEIEYPDRGRLAFGHETLALINYTVRFAKTNRNYAPNFLLRYATNTGKISLVHPAAETLIDPATYRRQRGSVNHFPDPRTADPQRLTFFVRGGYDPPVEGREGEERAHFTFMQPALYRRIEFVLDLSRYAAAAIEEPPVLFVVSKLQGYEFNCCEQAKGGHGQRPAPVNEDHATTRRYIWRFREFNSDKMVGVHWRIDHSKLDPADRVSEGELLALFGLSGP